VIRTAADLWLGRARRWAPALAFFLLAAGAFGVFRLRFAGEAEVSAQSLTAGRRALAALTADRETLEHDRDRIRANRAALEAFYGERLSTESRRLTRVIAEVKDLAARARLAPQAISYPEQEIEGFGLNRRSFVFGVEGGYAELRRLLNLLELSGSFLTLEQVKLVGGEGSGTLRIDLQLSTLFAAEDGAAFDDVAPPPAPAAPAPRRAAPRATTMSRALAEEGV
jgi:hypothetical protein